LWNEGPPCRTRISRWGAAYLLLALCLAGWARQFFAGIAEVTQDARARGNAFESGQSWPLFLSATFESRQSECLPCPSRRLP
jgi:hypothetical protein